MERGHVFASRTKVFPSEVRAMKCFRLNDSTFVAAGSFSGTLSILEKVGGTLSQIRSMDLNSSSITAILFLEKSMFSDRPVLLFGCRNGNISVWDANSLVTKDTTPLKITTIQDTTTCVCSLTPISDGGYAADSWDCMTRIRTQTENLEFHHGQFPAWFTVEADNAFFSGVADGNLVKRSRDGRVLGRIEKLHPAPIRAATLWGEHIITTSGDGSIRKVSLDLKKVEKLQPTDFPLFSAAACDTFAVIGGYDGLVFVLDLEKWAVIDVILVGTEVTCVDIVDDGDVVVGMNQGSVCIFTMHSDRKACDDEQEMYITMLENREFQAHQVATLDPRSLPAIPDPRTPVGSACAIRRHRGACLVFYSKGYQKWLVYGIVPVKVRSKDANGREYDTSITLIDHNEQMTTMYIDFGETPDENIDYYAKSRQLSLTSGVRKEIYDFLVDNLKGQFRPKNKKQPEQKLDDIKALVASKDCALETVFDHVLLSAALNEQCPEVFGFFKGQLRQLLEWSITNKFKDSPMFYKFSSLATQVLTRFPDGDDLCDDEVAVRMLSDFLVTDAVDCPTLCGNFTNVFVSFLKYSRGDISEKMEDFEERLCAHLDVSSIANFVLRVFTSLVNTGLDHNRLLAGVATAIAKGCYGGITLLKWIVTKKPDALRKLPEITDAVRAILEFCVDSSHPEIHRTEGFVTLELITRIFEQGGFDDILSEFEENIDFETNTISTKAALRVFYWRLPNALDLFLANPEDTSLGQLIFDRMKEMPPDELLSFVEEMNLIDRIIPKFSPESKSTGHVTEIILLMNTLDGVKSTAKWQEFTKSVLNAHIEWIESCKGFGGESPNIPIDTETIERTKVPRRVVQRELNVDSDSSDEAPPTKDDSSDDVVVEPETQEEEEEGSPSPEYLEMMRSLCGGDDSD